MKRLFLYPLALALWITTAGCDQQNNSKSPGDFEVNKASQTGKTASPAATGDGIEAFRRPLRKGQLPTVDTLNVDDFLAQHRFALSAPQCEQDICLQASVARKNTLISNSPSTMLMLGLNSAVDPSSLAGARRHIAVAIDSSQAMKGAVLQDVQRALNALRRELKETDRVTVIAMGSEAKFLARSASKDDLDLQDDISAVGELNLYDGLRSAFDELQRQRQPNERRILIAAMASNPSKGIVDPERLQRLIQSFGELGHNFHAVAVGEGLDSSRLRRISLAAGGHFHFVESSRDLDKVLSSPHALSKVTLAREIDIRIELGQSYQLRGAYGAKLHSKGDTHVTVRVPSFDVVAKKGSSEEASVTQKIVVLELKKAPEPADNRIGELSFSYLKGAKEERTKGGKKLLFGPSTPDGDYFEDDAARRAFGLISVYATFSRALELAAKDDHARALQMLDALRSGLDVWLRNSSPEPAVEQEMQYFKMLRDLIKASVKQSVPEGTPLLDPIIKPS